MTRRDVRCQLQYRDHEKGQTGLTRLVMLRQEGEHCGTEGGQRPPNLGLSRGRRRRNSACARVVIDESVDGIVRRKHSCLV